MPPESPLRRDVTSITHLNEVDQDWAVRLGDIKSFAQGRYIIARVLGEGGQKRVFLTHDTHLDRDVVIAVLKTRHRDERAVSRLRIEARALARLGDHPHIVTVHDIGEESGVPYIVTQYIDGGTVGSRLVDGPLPVPDALRICREVCEALQHAHDRGIVHRDLKPGNIWLTRTGTTKLGDFGLATGLELSMVTAENVLLGTLLYMAPEQAFGSAVDPRADLYSLGIVLYELITGRRPFIGDTLAAVLSQHLYAPPVAPSWHTPAIPPALDALVLRLLAKAPEDRVQSAREVEQALASIGVEIEAGGVVEGPKQQRSLDRLAAGVFVGRSAELDELRACLDRALGGRGGLMQIVGDAGAGKTAIAEQFATYARLRGAFVLRVQCFEGEGAPAYWPWVQVLRSITATSPTEQVLAGMGDAAHALVDLDSELTRRLPQVKPGRPLEPEQARFRLFDAVATLLHGISQAQPLILIIDDVHCADAASLRLLQFVSREVGHLRMVVVVTLRPVTVGPQHPLSQMIGLLARQGLERRILLEGLSEDDVRRFLEITTGTPAPDRLVIAVHQQTEGNPFFVKEVVRLLVAEGQFSSHDSTSWTLGLPQTVRDVVTLRLGQLSDTCNRVLAIASVAGRDFELETVRQVAEVSEDQLLDLLEEAIAARLVVESKQHPGTCRFSHALIRETLYECMSTSRRSRLHLKMASVLEQRLPEWREAALSSLAHHCFKALPLGSVDRAIRYAALAGEHADKRLAYEEAASHYQMALGALDTVPTPQPQRRYEFLMAFGNAQMKAGLSVEARGSFRLAADLARDMQSPVELAAAAMALGTGTAIRTRLGHAVDHEEIALLREALAGVGGNEGLRARLLAQLALALYHEPTERLALSEEAVRAGRTASEPDAVMASLYSRCVSLEGFPSAKERYTLATQMVRTAERIGDTENALRAHFRCYRDLIELGDIAGAESTLGQYVRLVETLRQPRFLWYVPYCRASLAAFRGEFDSATTLLTQAEAIGRRAQDPNAMLFCTVVRYGCLWHVGAYDEMERLLKYFVESYPSTGRAWRIQLARLYCVRGRLDEARELYAEALPGSLDALSLDGSYTSTLSALATICSYLRDRERARMVYERLQPYAPFNLVAGNTGNGGGAVSLALGIAANVLRDWDEAERLFDDAVTSNIRMGTRPWLAHTYWWYAHMLSTRARSGDAARAAALLDQRRALAGELGMPLSG